MLRVKHSLQLRQPDVAPLKLIGELLKRSLFGVKVHLQIAHQILPLLKLRLCLPQLGQQPLCLLGLAGDKLLLSPLQVIIARAEPADLIPLLCQFGLSLFILLRQLACLRGELRRLRRKLPVRH